MRRLLILFLFLSWNASAAFTEFYVQTNASNMNAGSTPDNSPTYTATGGFWTNATGVWRKDGQDLSGVTNGAWASVYPDSATTNVFVGLVTNVTTTNIWISLTAKAGTSPADDITGATTIRVGGAWKGPNSDDATGANTNQNWHPFNFVQSTMTNLNGNVPRINCLGSTTVTNKLDQPANNGPIVFQGYSVTPGDGGKYTINEKHNSADNINGTDLLFADMIVDGTGSGTSSSGFSVNNGECTFLRFTTRNYNRLGLFFSAGGCVAIECESYSNNVANPALGIVAGFKASSSAIYIRCISRDQKNSLGGGWDLTSASGASLINCIAYGNGTNGMHCVSGGYVVVKNCDLWNNGGSGISLLGAANSVAVIENCNFFKNGQWGITSPGSSVRIGSINNCAFGTGTQANTSGDISTNITAGVQSGIGVIGSLTYAANLHPWIDPTNGNFRIASGVAGKSAGQGLFTQVLLGSTTNTVSYPDIGAAQSASTNSAAAGGAYTWAQ